VAVDDDEAIGVRDTVGFILEERSDCSSGIGLSWSRDIGASVSGVDGVAIRVADFRALSPPSGVLEFVITRLWVVEEDLGLVGVGEDFICGGFDFEDGVGFLTIGDSLFSFVTITFFCVDSPRTNGGRT
jgi:hypothetical protein